MKNGLSILVLAVLFAFSACMNDGTQQTTVTAPSPEEVNKKAYREILRAFETGNTDSLHNYVTENSVDHDEPMPGIPATGPEHVKGVIASFRQSFPDAKFNYHHLVADGDMVLAHFTWTGTHTGGSEGMPATGKTVTGEMVDVLRFENGKVAEHWAVADRLPVMMQLGFVPADSNVLKSTAQPPSYNWDATVANDSAANTNEQKMKDAFNAVSAAIMAGDLSTVDQYMAADFKEHMQIPGVTIGDSIAGAKQAMTLLKQAYPDYKMNVHKMAAEGNVLIAYFTAEGTFAGMPGMPAETAGKKVSVPGADIVEFNSEGKAIAHWGVNDRFAEWTQLGLIPAPQAAPADAQTSAK